MRRNGRTFSVLTAGLALLLGGCPTDLGSLEFIAGGTGESTRLGTTASVSVVSPLVSLAISGGTPVEVNWSVVATTNFAAVDIVFDPDTTPDNGNEIVAVSGLGLGDTSALLDTSGLAAGSFNIGVRLFERNELAAFAYAGGALVINQQSDFFFESPRDNFVFDRTPDVVPRFDVSWQLLDPDSTVTVQIFLDPDATPNGNEFLLRESNSQTGDSFSFDLPTASLDAGEYRILAIISDGVAEVAVYAPGRIELRARLAGIVDLRSLGQSDSPIEGAIFEGVNPFDNAGSFVTSIGDIDGDGFDDFIVVAQFGKPLFDINRQRTGVGEAYLVYGRAAQFTGNINLNSTGALFRGEIYTGVPEVEDPIRPSRGVTSVTTLSDWDRDGIREIVWGLPFTDSDRVGAIGPLQLGTGAAPLDARGYFRSGAAVVQAGSSLRPDQGFPGRQTLNIASFGTLDHVNCTCNCPGADCPQSACQCPIGFVGPKAPSVPLQTGYTCFHQNWAGSENAPFAGSRRLGCRISSNEFGDQFGEALSTWEFDSLVMSVPNRDPAIATAALNSTGESISGAGVVSVYYCGVIGGFYPWRATNAPAANDAFGYVGTTDPIDAIFLPQHGPYHYIVDDFRTFAGGAGGGSSAPVQASPGYFTDEDNSPDPCRRVSHGGAPRPSRTLRLYGSFEGARVGNAVGIDDFNLDGLRDLLVGSPLSNDGRGACYIVLGRDRDLLRGAELDLEELGRPLTTDRTGGARLVEGIRVIGAPGARLGESQDNAGDFNGDGVPDVVIGSPLINNRRGGAAVFFGAREVINLTQDEIPFDELPDRGLGVIFVGEAEGDLVGARVRGVGDIDNDGNDDLLIAAPNKSMQVDLDSDGQLDIDRTNCGAVYLVYGSPDLEGEISLADIGTEDLPGAVFVGRESSAFLGAGLGEQGDRTHGMNTAGDVNGDGFRDLVFGSVTASPRSRTRAGEAYLVYGQGE